MRSIITTLFLSSTVLAVAQPCADIAPLACGQTVTFQSNGTGDAGYPNGFGHPGWYGLAGQGGPERIYRFIAAYSGTYQVNVAETIGGNSAEFFWKNDTLGCDATGWNFIGFTNFDNFPLAGIHWNAGDTLLLLVNQEGQQTEAVSFYIGCLPEPCTAIEPITCGQQRTYTTFGYGHPSYTNGFGHPGWYATAGQGGMEHLYRFGVPADGDYALVVASATAFQPVEFLWKSEDDGCDTTDWASIGYTDQSGHVFSGISWTAGDTVLILLNAESRELATTTFLVDCLGMGIHADRERPSIALYPQPSSGRCIVDGWQGSAPGVILNSSGAVVHRFQGAEPLTLDVDLPNGTYIVQVEQRRALLLIVR